jgi:hypothetical protein
MDRVLIADMAGGTGNPGNSSSVIGAMALGAGLQVGNGRRLVAGGQPAGGVAAAVGIEAGGAIWTPAPGQRKDTKQQQHGKQRITTSYL